MSKLKRENFNPYINWLPYAVLGKLQEADAVMREYKPQIIASANWFQEEIGQATKTLWRGVLLDPETNPEKGVSPREVQTFESWSEDRDVATWFALKDSVINSLLSIQNPTHEGYLAACTPKEDEIMWSHTWLTRLEKIMKRHLLPKHNTLLKIIQAQEPNKHQAITAKIQANWTLLTQKEVILLPGQTPAYFPINSLSHLPTNELDLKLNIPSWK